MLCAGVCVYGMTACDDEEKAGMGAGYKTADAAFKAYMEMHVTCDADLMLSLIPIDCIKWNASNKYIELNELESVCQKMLDDQRHITIHGETEDDDNTYIEYKANADWKYTVEREWNTAARDMYYVNQELSGLGVKNEAQEAKEMITEIAIKVGDEWYDGWETSRDDDPTLDMCVIKIDGRWYSYEAMWDLYHL